MKALVKKEVGKSWDGLELMDIPKPVPKKNELLIKIMATGICGTDLHIMEDEYPHSVPVVLGHEFTGIVEEVGKEVLDYILKADSNILESAYSENAEGVVNKVKIYDENDQYLGVVQNDELIGLVGVFQEIYIKEEDKQARTVAQSMLQGIAREAQVTVGGNTSCLSGKAIKIEDSLTKLVGSFYIESDEHEWSNSQYQTRIELIKL